MTIERPSLYTNGPSITLTNIGHVRTERPESCLRSDNNADITVIQMTLNSKITVNFISTGFGEKSVTNWRIYDYQNYKNSRFLNLNNSS